MQCIYTPFDSSVPKKIAKFRQKVFLEHPSGHRGKPNKKETYFKYIFVQPNMILSGGRDTIDECTVGNAVLTYVGNC